ncbi:MAG: carbohydrate kinase family protein [Balneolaceae bacterium]
MPANKEFDIMVVGELNVDLILDQLSKPPKFGEEQRADNMTLTLGSSTAIFASNSKSLGADIAFCGKVGKDDFGNLVMNTLAERGVNTDYILVDANLKTGATIIFNDHNESMKVTYPGSMEKMTVGEVPDELFKKSRHLHTSTIFFQPGIRKNLVGLFKKARDYGLTTSMDVQWDPEDKWDLDLPELLPVLDFFLPNEQELMNLTSTSTVEEALEELSGFDTCIVVKQGTKGALLQKHDQTLSVPAYKVPDFVDAVGAGDSFNAGFIYEYLNGKELEQCLIAGSLTAAVSTTMAGGTDAIESYQQVMNKGKPLEFHTS